MSRFRAVVEIAIEAEDLDEAESLVALVVDPDDVVAERDEDLAPGQSIKVVSRIVQEV